MDQLVTELKHLGLGDKEALVYLAALGLGPAPVQDIAKKAKVNRATTYVMIESLSTRGLMSSFVKGKKRFYVPESPERMLSMIRLQQKELAEKQQSFEKSLPLFLSLFNSEGSKPQIRYFEGQEGLRTLRETFEQMKGEFVQIVPYDDVLETREIMDDHKRHTRELHLAKTPHRVLVVMEHPDAEKIPSVGQGEVRIVSAKEFPLHGEITVRGNHVFLFSYKSSVLSVVIVSKEIADTVRGLFDLAWRGAAMGK